MLSRRSVNAQYIKAIEDAFHEDLVPFIDSNQDLEFYAIYFDINLITGELNCALNTEFDYLRRHRYYSVSEASQCATLRYNVSEWNYQGVVSIIPVETHLFETYYLSKPEVFAKMCVATIDALMHEHLKDFKGHVIVHCGDEPLNQSIKRYQKVCPLSRYALKDIL